MPAPNPIETLALSLGTADDVKAIPDTDLVSVYRLVCNRKTPRGKTKDDMIWAIVADLVNFRRRHVKAQQAAAGKPVL